MSKMSDINFLIVGGSGHWSERNHLATVNLLKSQGVNARVAVICDHLDPYAALDLGYKRPNLNKILDTDKPAWLDPAKYNEEDLTKILKKAIYDHKINIMVIAVNPVYHFFYADIALDEGVNVLCDKPTIAVRDASWSSEGARLIQERLQIVTDKVARNKKKNSLYSYCTPLRRRALLPYRTIASELATVHDQTGQCITSIKIHNNAGLHRYPVEFLHGGAHGYLDGIGSLAHGNYHYIDAIAWFIQQAPGKITSIVVSVPFVFRVQDYLSREDYKQLAKLNGEDMAKITTENIPEPILNAELDFTVVVTLYDDAGRKQGMCSFSSTHTSFTPRTVPYSSELIDPANHIQGGRTSHVSMDVDQGPLQNWLYVQNDVVFGGNTIEVTHSAHPRLAVSRGKQIYRDAYSTNTVTPQELSASFAKHCVGMDIPEDHRELLNQVSLEGQQLTNDIYAAAYLLIANDYEGKNSSVRLSIKKYGV